MTTADVSTTSPVPFLARTYLLPESASTLTRHHATVQGTNTLTIVDAILATSAAPAYFKVRKLEVAGLPKTLVDGGIVANNPTELAYFETQCFWGPTPIELIVSIGTGLHTQQFVASPRSLLKWGHVLVDLATDGDRIHKNFQLYRAFLHGLESPKFQYLRLNPRMIGDYDLSDATEPARKAFLHHAEEALAEASVKTKLNEIKSLLDQ